MSWRNAEEPATGSAGGVGMTVSAGPQAKQRTRCPLGWDASVQPSAPFCTIPAQLLHGAPLRANVVLDQAIVVPPALDVWCELPLLRPEQAKRVALLSSHETALMI
ncbi:MAG: hypothetical protein ACYCOU_12025 [Sulfobacillus sp.]